MGSTCERGNVTCIGDPKFLARTLHINFWHCTAGTRWRASQGRTDFHHVCCDGAFLRRTSTISFVDHSVRLGFSHLCLVIFLFVLEGSDTREILHNTHCIIIHFNTPRGYVQYTRSLGLLLDISVPTVYLPLKIIQHRVRLLATFRKQHISLYNSLLVNEDDLLLWHKNVEYIRYTAKVLSMLQCVCGEKSWYLSGLHYVLDICVCRTRASVGKAYRKHLTYTTAASHTVPPPSSKIYVPF